MKGSILTIGFLLLIKQLSAQNAEYFTLISRADSLYNAKNYPASAKTFSQAFKLNRLKVQQNDLYNAGCSWALSNNPDSAFVILNRAVKEKNYCNLNYITTDSDLILLHHDNRWPGLIELIKANKVNTETYFTPIVKILDSVLKDDQEGRLKIEEVGKAHGYKSKEMDELWHYISFKDSIDLVKVEAILDRYGWLGPETIGDRGNFTLFLVIQHSDIKVQEKYLPMMRRAVDEGKAQPANLALLEDRVALRQGKKQIYGSQVKRDPKQGKVIFSQLKMNQMWIKEDGRSA